MYLGGRIEWTMCKFPEMFFFKCVYFQHVQDNHCVAIWYSLLRKKKKRKKYILVDNDVWVGTCVILHIRPSHRHTSMDDKLTVNIKNILKRLQISLQSDDCLTITHLYSIFFLQIDNSEHVGFFWDIGRNFDYWEYVQYIETLLENLVWIRVAVIASDQVGL